MCKINVYMKSVGTQIKRTSGFTLVELLVVIGILGILVAALIAAIDPIEQLRKASDTSTKAAISQFNDSVIRYYANHQALPWAAGGDASCSANAGSSFNTNAKALIDLTSCMNAIISDNELKASFTANKQVLSKIFVSGTTSGVVSCFDPQSKQGEADPLTKYDSTGGAGSPTTFFCIK